MSQPNKIPRAFAASGDKNSIPDSTGNLGFASWQEGFPAITSEPFSNGGVAPKRADFNGIFNALSLATLWQQQGGVYAYDNTTDYEVGNLVEDSGDIYQCMVANGPNSSIKSPSDQTVWSKVINVQDLNSILASYLPLSGGNVTNGTNSLSLLPGLVEISAVTPFIDFHHANAAVDHTARIINDQDGRLVVAVQNDTNTQNKSLNLNIDGTLTWDGKDVATIQTGTWTPVLKGSRTDGAFTYSMQVGIYHKIGKLVYIYGQLVPTACTTLPTGDVRISGLPYVAHGVPDARIMSIWGRANGFDSNSAQKIIGFYVAGQSSVLIARTNTNDSTIGISSYSEAVWSNTAATLANVKVSVASYGSTGINFAGLYLAQ